MVGTGMHLVRYRVDGIVNGSDVTIGGIEGGELRDIEHKSVKTKGRNRIGTSN
jgi:hypothetical protein